MISKTDKKVIWACVLFCAAVHLYLLGKFSINYPFRDDYRVFVNYLHYFFNYERTIFLPDNESYPVLMRLITLFQFHVDGALNFQHILWFCHLFLMVILAALSSHFYRKGEYGNIAIVFLLGLSGMHHELYFRTDVITYQTLSFAFALFLFYGAAYYQEMGGLLRVLFYTAFLLTPLGSVNGMLANVLVVLYFLLNGSSKKRFVLLASILAVQLAAILLSGEGKSFNVWENISKYHIELVYAYFLSMGGILHVVNNTLIWPVVAVLSAGMFGYTFYRLFFPFEWKLNFEKLLFLFCAGSLALIVVLRYNYWMEGYVSVLESRYKIYGALIFLLFFAILLRTYRKLRPLVLAFLLGLFVVGWYKGEQMLKIQQLEQITEAYNVQQGGYEQRYARTFFVNSEQRNYLQENGIFSFERGKVLMDSLLQEGNRLTDVQSSALELIGVDPISAGDWTGMPVRMSQFMVRGNFPLKNYYFVKFAGDTTSCVQFLLPPPIAMLDLIGRGEASTVNELGKNFYAEAFEGIDFTSFEIYGVDDLGL